jgi:hypothetical protein
MAQFVATSNSTKVLFRAPGWDIRYPQVNITYASG